MANENATPVVEAMIDGTEKLAAATKANVEATVAAGKAQADTVRKVAAKAPRRAKAVTARQVRKVAAGTRKAVRSGVKATRQAARTNEKTARQLRQMTDAATAPVETALKASSQFERMMGMNMNFFGQNDQFQALFADAGQKSQDYVAKSQKMAEDMADFARGNMEAMVEATRIATSGLRSLSQTMAETGREGIEQASDNMKALAEAKSPTEFFQLQTEAAKGQFDRFVAEGSKITEQWVKLMGEAAQPLQTRASLAAQRVNQLVA